LGLFQNFVSRELETDTASKDSAKAAALTEVQKLLRGVYRLIDLEKTKDAPKSPEETRATKSVINLCKAIFEEPTSSSATVELDKIPQIKTLQRSALPLLCHSIQDTAASTNQIVGRTMGIKTNSNGVKAASGTYTYDILFK